MVETNLHVNSFSVFKLSFSYSSNNDCNFVGTGICKLTINSTTKIESIYVNRI